MAQLCFHKPLSWFKTGVTAIGRGFRNCCAHHRSWPDGYNTSSYDVHRDIMMYWHFPTELQRRTDTQRRYRK